MFFRNSKMFKVAYKIVTKTSIYRTLPAIYVRTIKGRVVIRNPGSQLREELGDVKIQVVPLPEEQVRNQTAHAMITAIFSVLVPWMAVILGYYTPPIGYGCRAKYLTVICCIWTFNSILSYCYQLTGERTLKGQTNALDSFIHGWLSVSGIIVAVLLLLLALMTSNPSWWVRLFGDPCDLTTCGQV